MFFQASASFKIGKGNAIISPCKLPVASHFRK
jgi:hypothetical protein